MAKILIVDDDLVYIRIYQLKLKADGYIVEVASTLNVWVRFLLGFSENLPKIMSGGVDTIEKF